MAPVIYAMVGAIGSGKTTYARKIASEKRALLFCIDEGIKLLELPVAGAEDYERLYFGVRAIIADHAVRALQLGTSVVLDFGGNVGHWPWLQSVAAAGGAEIEIFHLLAPLEVRRERVRARNLRPDVIFRFSDHDFDSMPVESAAPPAQDGLRVIEIHSDA